MNTTGAVNYETSETKDADIKNGKFVKILFVLTKYSYTDFEVFSDQLFLHISTLQHKQ